jgi:hypothetical protein
MVLAGDKRRPVRYSLNEVSPYVCGKDYSVSNRADRYPAGRHVVFAPAGRTMFYVVR